MMEEGNNKNSIYLFPSFLLSVLLVENPPSGLCSTDETVSYVETNFNFFPTKHKLSPSAKLKLSQMFMSHEKLVLKEIENSHNLERI